MKTRFFAIALLLVAATNISAKTRTLQQIKTEMAKFNYDFLSGHFAKWKEIMKKAK